MPRLLVLTDRSRCPTDLPATVAVAVAVGARAVVLREKDLPESDRAHLIREVRAVVDAADGVLIVAGPRGDAVHLSAVDRFPTPRPVLVGRSCHTPDEVARATAEGCDYVTVSPVFPTPSKPGYGPPLGFAGLAALIRTAPLAYALGGVKPADVPGCLTAGAYGVAVMGSVMRDARIIVDYLAAMEAPAVSEQRAWEACRHRGRSA
jgi:thiamine-phosphate diphosphorylase